MALLITIGMRGLEQAMAWSEPWERAMIFWDWNRTREILPGQINPSTNEPTPEAHHAAVRAVPDTPTYRTPAMAIAREFDAIDTAAAILDRFPVLSRSDMPLARA